MSDVIDRGRAAGETDSMRATREAVIASSPPPQFFKLRAPVLADGRSNQTKPQELGNGAAADTQ